MMLFDCCVIINGDFCYLLLFYKNNYVNTIHAKILAKNKNNKCAACSKMMMGSLTRTMVNEF